MKKFLGLALMGLLSAGGSAFAVVGTIDVVPAATLLLPYFEVDVARENGADTLFSVNNATPNPVLAHVTIWTDQAVPAMNFDVYLTGYDVQTLSLRDLFVNGNVPVTAAAGQDPQDTISPRGLVSQDYPLPGCESLPYSNPQVSALMRAHLRAWLQGRRSPTTDDCAGARQQDSDILRGYVTIDTVKTCNMFYPSDWLSYRPFLTFDNVLWGDVFYVNPAQNFAQGDSLVHIEACPLCFEAGDHTFYGRYNAATASDAREALPTIMATRFVNGGEFDGGTNLIVWREANSAANSYFCSLQGPQPWYPLEVTQAGVFDEEEQPVVAETCPSFPTNCNRITAFQNAAQRADISQLSPFDFGWIYLNLQNYNLIYSDPYTQMWLTTTMDAVSRFSVGFDAIQIDNANAPVVEPLPLP